MRPIFKGIAFGVLLTSLVGCGSKSPSNVVRLMTWPLANTDPITDRVEKLFEKEHPGYDLKVEKVPIRGYEEKLIVLMGAKDPPDVAILPQFRYPEYVRQGALSDITRKAGAKNSLIPIPEAQLRALQIEGKLLAIPSGFKDIVWVVPASAKHKNLAWSLLELLTQEGYTKLTHMPEPRLSMY